LWSVFFALLASLTEDAEIGKIAILGQPPGARVVGKGGKTL